MRHRGGWLMVVYRLLIFIIVANVMTITIISNSISISNSSIIIVTFV